MARTCTFLLAGAIVALAAGGAPAAAPVPADTGKNVIFPFPAKAPVVVQVHGLERTADRVKKLVAAAVPDFAKLANTAVDDGLKQLLKDRQLAAIPKDGRAYLVLHDITRLAEEEPAVSLVVPVTDYAKFKATFLTEAERKSLEKGAGGVETIKSTLTGEGATVYLVDLKEHVVLSGDKGAAEAFAGKYERATTATLGAELAATFQAADVGVYVNLEVINDLYGAQIRQARGFIDLIVAQAQLGGMGQFDKKQAEQLKAVLTGMFQGVEDARGVVIGAEFREAGLLVRAHGRFTDESKTGRFLKGEKPTSLADLPNLPKGLVSYNGHTFGKSVAEVIRSVNDEFAVPDDDEKAGEAVKKQLAALDAAGPGGEYAAASVPATSLTVSAYQDPAKAVAAIVGLYKVIPAGGKVQSVVLKEKPAVKADARTHGGFTFTEVGLAFDFDATAKELPEAGREAALKMFKRLVSEKMTVWVGTDGKRVLRLVAKDWPAAEQLLTSYLGGTAGIGSDAGFKLTRANLPAEANMVMMAETGETLKVMAEAMKAVAEAVPGFPLGAGELKVPKGEPTYLGVAVTLKAETAAVDVFIPAAAASVAAKMLGPLLKGIE